MAVIPHDRKPDVIAGLRSVGNDQASVRFDWHKRGQLTLIAGPGFKNEAHHMVLWT